MTRSPHGPLRVGIGGPVGSGKTALMEVLCKRMRDRYDLCAITNDIYTKEDARLLTVAGALPQERIMGVETGGCPHTAIREDCSINLAAVEEMRGQVPGARPDPDRIRRRQPRGDLLAGTGGPDDLRHRRRGRRKDPAQGRAGHHALRSAGHQQDRSRPACRRGSCSDGPGFADDARQAPLRLHQYARRRGRRGGGGFHRDGGRPAGGAGGVTDGIRTRYGTPRDPGQAAKRAIGSKRPWRTWRSADAAG